MFTIRKKLFASEGTDPNTRYDETCECVQSTFDGGLTWVDNPAADPRTSAAFLNPGSDDKCNAAQGVANFVSAFLDGAYSAFNIVGISSWAIQIGFFFTPLGLFYRIALAVADGLVNIGSITLMATFDSDTFDEIRDIAFCYLDEDGKFPNQEAFDAFGEQLQEDIGGSAFNIVMALMFNLYGWVGFSNAALEYAEGSDCSGASCRWCRLSDFTVDADGWVAESGLGTYVPGVGWQRVLAGGTTPALFIKRTFSVSNTIDTFIIEYTQVGTGGAVRRIYYDASGYIPLSLAQTSNPGTDVLTAVRENSDTVTIPNILFNWSANASSGVTFTLTKIIMEGDTDPNPVGDNNCI